MKPNGKPPGLDIALDAKAPQKCDSEPGKVENSFIPTDIVPINTLSSMSSSSTLKEESDASIAAVETKAETNIATIKLLSSMSSSESTLPEESDTAIVAIPPKPETAQVPNKINDPATVPTSTTLETDGTKEDDPKKRQGWPERKPFSKRRGDQVARLLKEYSYWSDLTWKEKYAFRKEFLGQYLAETRKCIPHVRRFFMMIYRISPWRAVVILVLNIINSLLPALTLQTRGSFILLVNAFVQS
jgi:hypothetical protein